MKSGREMRKYSLRQPFDKTIFRIRSTISGLISWHRTVFWRWLGMRVGTGTRLPPVHVTWPHQVALGAGCMLEHNISFKFDGPWREGPSIVIGNHVFIGAGCEFNIHAKISVGDETMISAGCRFIDSDHGFSDRSLSMFRQAGRKEPIAIGSDVWIGANAIVLRGVSIGRGAIVAAGAVVAHSIPEFEVWGGVPAKKLSVRPNTGDARP